MSKFTVTLMAIVTVFGLQLYTCALGADHSLCRTECLHCANLCDSTMQHCHELTGEHNTVDHMNALQDCVSLCRQSAEFIARNSQLSGKLCGLCADSCIKCAQSCEAFKNDKAMQACARQCRTCAQSCLKMAG